MPLIASAMNIFFAWTGAVTHRATLVSSTHVRPFYPTPRFTSRTLIRYKFALAEFKALANSHKNPSHISNPVRASNDRLCTHDTTTHSAVDVDISIYVDGSKMHAGGIGAAAIMQQSGRADEVSTLRLAGNYTSQQAEYAAMKLGLEVARHARDGYLGSGCDKDSTKVHTIIYTDYKGAIDIPASIDPHTLMPSGDSHGYTADTCRDIARHLYESRSSGYAGIEPRLIRGHSGINGNVKAHKEARRAARQCQTGYEPVGEQGKK